MIYVPTLPPFPSPSHHSLSDSLIMLFPIFVIIHSVKVSRGRLRGNLSVRNLLYVLKSTRSSPDISLSGNLVFFEWDLVYEECGD